MGYRLRLGRISKKVHEEKYKGKSYEELTESIFNEDSKFYFYRPEEHEELHELGKYVGFKYGRSPFYDFDVEEYTEGEFDILSKEGLLKIIEHYHNNTLEHFQDLFKLIDSTEEIDRHEIKFYFRSKVNEWNRSFDLLPYWLDEEITDGPIVRSWKIEYAIFNLVYLYRYFDWENDYLIYSGW